MPFVAARAGRGGEAVEVPMVAEEALVALFHGGRRAKRLGSALLAACCQQFVETMSA